MTRDQITGRLYEFVQENFLYMRPDFELGFDDSLLGKGIIDSMGVAEMMYFLEEEFGVTVADEDVTEENLGTLHAIASYVEAHASERRESA